MTVSENQAAEPAARSGPLSGIRVLDLSRILAGPTATQLLGDLGADVIKIERPDLGDDTRRWGPPFVQVNGADSQESAYYLCANRNKRSLAIDMASDAGQKIIREIAKVSDIVVENFKVGDLARRGLDYESLKAINPRLIYCSISGFGQSGPYAPRAGYDFLIQGMGGIMSLTGQRDEDGGVPTKAGVGIADVVCGMYASNAILAALYVRTRTGAGQYIDIALLDTQVAWLINQGAAYLTDRKVPGRLGNGHPTIVPYETFPASDRQFILAVGNDSQFRKFLEAGGRSELMDDPRFATNVARVRNRDHVVPVIAEITRTRSADEWLDILSKNGVPCGPVNNLEDVFSDPQIRHREMEIVMAHETADAGHVTLIGNPIKLSDTPVTYRLAPPRVGEHSAEILRDLLNLSEAEIKALTASGAISDGRL
ncbi:MAG: CoA transferase [Rhizobiales bacterium]|nr:CoA transferase [Hyphomicrobiales bacterium]